MRSRFSRGSALSFQRQALVERFGAPLSAVRLVCAPAGFGKSILAAQVTQLHHARCKYVSFLPGDDAAAVHRRLMRLAGVISHESSLDAALDAVENAAPAMLILDHADATSESGREAVSAFIAALDSRIGLTLCMRSVDRLIDPGWLCDGTAEMIDARVLAFTPEDVSRMCADLAIAFEDRDAAALVRETDGWPIVVAGTLRLAATNRVPLRDAYRFWYRECGKAFADFIATQCERSAYGEQLLAAFCGERPIAAADLELWQRTGLFTFATADGAKVLAPVGSVLRSFRAEQAHSGRATLVAKLFGGSQVRIGSDQVQWVRRKDSQVFKYLLLKETHSATRAELMKVFWTDRDPQIAAQGLRTTCSNIRHAIRAVVGEDRVDAYFTAEGDSVIVRANIVTDVAEFLAHVGAARSGAAHGSHARVAGHLEKARDIYRGDLLTGMPSCGFESFATQLRAHLAYVIQRLNAPQLRAVDDVADESEQAASA
ncbi:MAG TPA: BTAD domain-containing putative transcriptional regulator [Candidatus Baltobacteraceae bacterium]|nr:BTAD domain-containing putative transcriptional regulator [Candidatus Baltobacteraceae bacterium]